MGDEFHVDTDAMRAHAGRLDQISASGQSTTDAAQGLATDSDAFGILCQFVYSALAPVQSGGVEGAKAAQQSVTNTATNLRGMADAYDFVDDGINKLFSTGGS